MLGSSLGVAVVRVRLSLVKHRVQCKSEGSGRLVYIQPQMEKNKFDKLEHGSNPITPSMTDAGRLMYKQLEQNSQWSNSPRVLHG
jgi:hypothetical protein